MTKGLITMKIGLLQCDHIAEPFQHIIRDYPERFRDLFARYAPEIELVVYDVCHGQLPAAVDECAGYLTTGSKYSVYDDIDWIHALADFVRSLHESRQKLVGICFGHQMIAHALGGSVAKSDHGWGIGSKPVQLLKLKPWMQPEKSAYQLLLSHQDQVQSLPEEAEIIGSNEHCPISMFTIGEHFLGIQAHPEFTAPYAEALMDSRVERIGMPAISAAKETLQTPTDEAEVSQWIQSFLTS